MRRGRIFQVGARRVRQMLGLTSLHPSIAFQVPLDTAEVVRRRRAGDLCVSAPF